MSWHVQKAGVLANLIKSCVTRVLANEADESISEAKPAEQATVSSADFAGILQPVLAIPLNDLKRNFRVRKYLPERDVAGFDRRFPRRWQSPAFARLSSER